MAEMFNEETRLFIEQAFENIFSFIKYDDINKHKDTIEYKIYNKLLENGFAIIESMDVNTEINSKSLADYIINNIDTEFKCFKSFFMNIRDLKETQENIENNNKYIGKEAYEEFVQYYLGLINNIDEYFADSEEKSKTEEEKIVIFLKEHHEIFKRYLNHSTKINIYNTAIKTVLEKEPESDLSNIIKEIINCILENDITTDDEKYKEIGEFLLNLEQIQNLDKSKKENIENIISEMEKDYKENKELEDYIFKGTNDNVISIKDLEKKLNKLKEQENLFNKLTKKLKTVGFEIKTNNEFGGYNQIKFPSKQQFAQKDTECLVTSKITKQFRQLSETLTEITLVFGKDKQITVKNKTF